MSLATRAFHGCYLLVSRASKTSSRTYIGFTVNPSRRIRQHNGAITSGAYRTKRGRPWEMVLVLYGFTTQVQALQFEWAWQHPEKSKAARVVAAGMKKSQRYGAKGKVRLLVGMLHESPWCYYPLTLQFMSQEHAQLMAGCPAAPPYVDVVVAPMEALPKSLAVADEHEQQQEEEQQQSSGASTAAEDSDECGCSSDGVLAGSDDEETLFQRLEALRPRQLGEADFNAGCDGLQAAEADAAAAESPKKGRQKKEKGPRCQQCERAIERHMLSCGCGAHFHIDCLAQSFQQQQQQQQVQGPGQQQQQPKQGQQQQQQRRAGAAAPADGRCPVCGARLVWMEVLERMQSYGGPQPARTSRQKRRAPKGTAATKAATAATKPPRAKAKRAALSTGDSNDLDDAAHPPSPKPKRKPRKATSKTAATADGAAGEPTTELDAIDGVQAQPPAAEAAAAAKPVRKRQPRKPRDGDATAGDATWAPCDQPQPADVATKAVRKRQLRKPKDATAARPPSNHDQAAAAEAESPAEAAGAATGAAVHPGLASILQQLVARLAQVCPGVALPYDRPDELLALVRMALPGMEIPPEALQQAAAAAAAAAAARGEVQTATPSLHCTAGISHSRDVVDLLSGSDCSDQEASSTGRSGSDSRGGSYNGSSSSSEHSEGSYGSCADGTPPKRRRAVHDALPCSEALPQPAEPSLGPSCSYGAAAAAATPSPGPLLRRLRLASASPAVVPQALNPDAGADAGDHSEGVVDLCGPSPAPLWQRLAAAAPCCKPSSSAAGAALTGTAAVAALGLTAATGAAVAAKQHGQVTAATAAAAISKRAREHAPVRQQRATSMHLQPPATAACDACSSGLKDAGMRPVAGTQLHALPSAAAAAATGTATAMAASPDGHVSLRKTRFNGTTPAAMQLRSRLEAADIITIDSD